MKHIIDHALQVLRSPFPDRANQMRNILSQADISEQDFLQTTQLNQISNVSIEDLIVKLTPDMDGVLVLSIRDFDDLHIIPIYPSVKLVNLLNCNISSLDFITIHKQVQCLHLVNSYVENANFIGSGLYKLYIMSHSEIKNCVVNNKCGIFECDNEYVSSLPTFEENSELHRMVISGTQITNVPNIFNKLNWLDVSNSSVSSVPDIAYYNLIISNSFITGHFKTQAQNLKAEYCNIKTIEYTGDKNQTIDWFLSGSDLVSFPKLNDKSADLITIDNTKIWRLPKSISNINLIACDKKLKQKYPNFTNLYEK